jgi:hypothetical protein
VFTRRTACLAVLVGLFFASVSAAQVPSSEKLNARSLEAAVSFAQSLAQWEFIIVGGSLLLIVGSSHGRPASKKIRASYLLFLPAWFSLGYSIYSGTRAQQVYLAYLLVPATTIEGATSRIGEDIQAQRVSMLVGLVFLFLWLLIYLAWWIFTDDTSKG